MKWPKIIIVIAAVVMLFSGISIAGYGYLYPVRNIATPFGIYFSNGVYFPVFKIEFPQNTSFSFIDNCQLNQKFIIEREILKPASVKIEEIARIQETINKCI